MRVRAAVIGVVAIVALLGFAWFCRINFATLDRTGFVDCECVGPDGRPVRYVTYVPPEYRPDRDWPLIVFLHGTGERGTDGRTHLRVGLAPSINKVRREGKTAFDFVALFPQSRSGQWEPGSPDEARLEAALADARSRYALDARRLYLTGHSSGGTGAWCLAAATPGRWAAVAPLCGTVDPSGAAALASVPCWYFHGTDDTPESVVQADALIRAVRAAGGVPRYSLLPSLGHGIWPEVYGDPAFYNWLRVQQSSAAAH